MRLWSRPASLSSDTRSFSDWRTCRSSSHAPLSALAPSQIRNRSTRASAEFRTAMPRMRHRIGSRRATRSNQVSRAEPAGRLPGMGAANEAASGSFADAVDKSFELRIGQEPVVNAGHGTLERLPVNVLGDRHAAELRLAPGAILPQPPLLA